MIDLEFTPAEFESIYLALYKWHRRATFPPEMSIWLGRVFSAVNDYSPRADEDPDLIDGSELWRQVEVAMRGLEDLGVVRRLPAQSDTR